MTLLEVVRDLDSFDKMSTIFAVEPFSEHSEVVVSDREESEIAPKWAVERGVTYFLEVFIAREVLEDWVIDKEPTLLEKCRRIIQYAINDA